MTSITIITACVCLFACNSSETKMAAVSTREASENVYMLLPFSIGLSDEIKARVEPYDRQQNITEQLVELFSFSEKNKNGIGRIKVMDKEKPVAFMSIESPEVQIEPTYKGTPLNRLQKYCNQIQKSKKRPKGIIFGHFREDFATDEVQFIIRVYSCDESKPSLLTGKSNINVDEIRSEQVIEDLISPSIREVKLEFDKIKIAQKESTLPESPDKPLGDIRDLLPTGESTDGQKPPLPDPKDTTETQAVMSLMEVYKALYKQELYVHPRVDNPNDPGGFYHNEALLKLSEEFGVVQKDVIFKLKNVNRKQKIEPESKKSPYQIRVTSQPGLNPEGKYFELCCARQYLLFPHEKNPVNKSIKGKMSPENYETAQKIVNNFNQDSKFHWHIPAIEELFVLTSVLPSPHNVRIKPYAYWSSTKNPDGKNWVLFMELAAGKGKKKRVYRPRLGISDELGSITGKPGKAYLLPIRTCDSLSK